MVRLPGTRFWKNVGHHLSSRWLIQTKRVPIIKFYFDWYWKAQLSPSFSPSWQLQPSWLSIALFCISSTQRMLVSKLWASCEQVVSKLWASAEQALSKLWAICEQFVSNLWAIYDQANIAWFTSTRENENAFWLFVITIDNYYLCKPIFPDEAVCKTAKIWRVLNKSNDVNLLFLWGRLSWDVLWLYT